MAEKRHGWSERQIACGVFLLRIESVTGWEVYNLTIGSIQKSFFDI